MLPAKVFFPQRLIGVFQGVFFGLIVRAKVLPQFQALYVIRLLQRKALLPQSVIEGFERLRPFLTRNAVIFIIAPSGTGRPGTSLPAIRFRALFFLRVLLLYMSLYPLDAGQM